MRKILTILIMLVLFSPACTGPEGEKNYPEAIEKLQTENDSLRNVLTQNKLTMKNQMITSLTFQDNNAENAMNFYVEVFDNAKVISVKRWQKGGPGEEGKIMQALFSLDGNLFMCSDSRPVHDWDFSPAVSNYIECENESELETLFSRLSKNGNVTMPPDNYGFSQKFAWVIDQYGVSWQLNFN